MTDTITEQLRTLQDAAENPSGEWAQFRSRPAPAVERGPVMSEYIKMQCAHFGGAPERCLLGERNWGPGVTPKRCGLCPHAEPVASRPAPTVEPVANRLMAVCERLANTPMEMSLGDWGECSVVMREAAATISALEAERDEARKQLAAVTAERDRAQKACEQIAKRFTPCRLRYAPKDRTIIGVERPPYEETTFFYDLIWDESRQNFVVPYINAFNGASHFLDPRDLIGLPPQERLSREERKKANARAALTGGEDA